MGNMEFYKLLNLYESYNILFSGFFLCSHLFLSLKIYTEDVFLGMLMAMLLLI